MGIISVENTDRLYWLGRYTERVYTTLRIFADLYDSMIDLSDDEYRDYCIRQEIPDIYTSTEDFAERYCFDEADENSILANMMRAYDNAIVLREEIGSVTLSYIQLAVYAMHEAKDSAAPLLAWKRRGIISSLSGEWSTIAFMTKQSAALSSSASRSSVWICWPVCIWIRASCAARWPA